MSSRCLLCGAYSTGFVAVYAAREESWVAGTMLRRIGRACSSHTLADLILSPQDRFYVEITADPLPVASSERGAEGEPQGV